MQCYEAESLLVDYLDSVMDPADRKRVEVHLKDCPLCRQALEEYRQLFTDMQNDKIQQPGAALRTRFEGMLQQEMEIATTTEPIQLNTGKGAVVKPVKQYAMLLRVAAVFTVLLSLVFIGIIIMTNRRTNSEVAALKNEINAMKGAMAVKLLQDESASERIKAVSYADAIAIPDNEILTALITTMNEDRNVNVRLAALYTLEKFADNKKISDALVSSLSRQSEPLMQIALMNVLIEKKNAKAKALMQEIMQDKNTLLPVKEMAQKGFNTL
ncbi:MAG: zf-HC2 domain-containing protein [Chitinophagaceae bacterium]